ncbi:MAG: hypothetical protein MUF15_04250 [Acidobacteria bacterium]|jgi:hypothetical protein|nr:hypothetical protein [Acidobacteriota bacterium]
MDESKGGLYIFFFIDYNFFLKLEVELQTLEIFKEFSNKKLDNYPEIIYSSLFRKVSDTFHFEFQGDREEDKYLFSPFYTQLRGESIPEFLEFIGQNEPFLDSLRGFIIASLFVYSALIDENSYYLDNPQSIFIARLLYKKEARFEIKFYTHYKDELMESYDDKIYIGRDFINLEKFDRKYLGLKKFFRSLVEQNEKIQERAKHKLRYFEDYEKPFLNEIDYQVKETVDDAMERIKLFPEVKLANISKAKLIDDVLDNVLYLLNLMIELRDLTEEFENKLRLREENDFVKYLTKFSKDVIDGIRYLRKLSCQMHLKISNYSIY